MKVSELQGAALDYWVAKAGHLEVTSFESPAVELYLANGFDRWSPSTDWAQGGPIIERQKIAMFCDKGCWQGGYGIDCEMESYFINDVVGGAESPVITLEHRMRAETPLVAAMRAYVASKFGDEVDHIA